MRYAKIVFNRGSMALRNDQELCINKALEFANLKIKSTEQVEDTFLPLQKFFGGEVVKSISPKKVPFELLGFKSFEEAEQFGIENFTKDQADLFGRLLGLTRNQIREEDIGDWLGELLIGKVDFIPAFIHGKIDYRVKLTGVEAAFGYAVALLVDTGYAKHLHQCPICDRIFVIYDPKKRQKKYCGDKCQAIARKAKSVERQQRFRDSKRYKPPH